MAAGTPISLHSLKAVTNESEYKYLMDWVWANQMRGGDEERWSDGQEGEAGGEMGRWRDREGMEMEAAGEQATGRGCGLLSH